MFMKDSDVDLKSITNLENFSGVVPVFPLSTVVFFPNTLLPLHIFESRYRQMVSDAMDGDRIIAMALLKPGWEKNYYGNPDIFDVMGMGRIVSFEKFEDGRSNIVLYGLKRVRIIEITDQMPYRSARVEIMENTRGNNEDSYRRQIVDVIDRWNSMLGEERKSHKINIDSGMPLETLTDVLISLIIPNVFEKQTLLEETNIEKRAAKVLGYFETKLRAALITSEREDEIMDKRDLN